MLYEVITLVSAYYACLSRGCLQLNDERGSVNYRGRIVFLQSQKVMAYLDFGG